MQGEHRGLLWSWLGVFASHWTPFPKHGRGGIDLSATPKFSCVLLFYGNVFIEPRFQQALKWNSSTKIHPSRGVEQFKKRLPPLTP